MFLHNQKDIKDLFVIIADEKKVLPYLVEKDYWIMHALWGLKNKGFNFELKGGTSLSKGYGIIDRFSEDLDIKIYPDNDQVKIGKNHNKLSHIESRKKYFDKLTSELNIPDMVAVRSFEYDDKKMRNGGILLEYDNLFSHIPGIKQGILLEVGFDQTQPNEQITISSWAYEKAKTFKLNIKENIAQNILCYFPEYTFVEKLQAVSTKVYRQQVEGKFSNNFLRHFYDIYILLTQPRVINFLGTEDYISHKLKRFRANDELDISKNLAFNLDKDKAKYNLYKSKYDEIKPLFFNKFYNFDIIYQKIIEFRERM